MSQISKVKFVSRLANGLDMPKALLAAMTEPCSCADEQCDGWKVTRMPDLEEIQKYGLEERFAMSGWRTSLSAIIED